MDVPPPRPDVRFSGISAPSQADPADAKGKETESPCHFQNIARQGACRKAQTGEQNGRPRPRHCGDRDCSGRSCDPELPEYKSLELGDSHVRRDHQRRRTDGDDAGQRVAAARRGRARAGEGRGAEQAGPLARPAPRAASRSWTSAGCWTGSSHTGSSIPAAPAALPRSTHPGRRPANGERCPVTSRKPPWATLGTARR